MASGFVKWFDDESGYGCIVPDKEGKDLFVHRGNIVGDWRKTTLNEPERVKFEPRKGVMGPEAINVRPLDAR